MLNIKMFEEYSRYNLELEVNNFIDTNYLYEITDIKFSIYCCDDKKYYCAMIIYKTENEYEEDYD